MRISCARHWKRHAVFRQLWEAVPLTLGKETRTGQSAADVRSFLAGTDVRDDESPNAGSVLLQRASHSGHDESHGTSIISLRLTNISHVLSHIAVPMY